MDKKWLSDNLIGIIAIVVAILIVVIPFIIRKLRNKKAGLRIVLLQQPKSYFCVEGDYTRLMVQVMISNDEDLDLVLTKFKFKILSPFKDRHKTTQLYDTVRTASELKLGYAGLTIAGKASVPKQLVFKAPVIRRTTKNLKCKLKVYDRHRRYNASCKFNLPREGR